METLTKSHEQLNFESLIMHIEQGKILIPHFQRKFIWKLKDTARLLDSIFKNVPTGNIVIWQTHNKMRSERKIGNLEIPEYQGDYSYLLDGQQRSTSLFLALKGMSVDSQNFRQLFVDLNVNPRIYSFDSIVHVITSATVPENMFPIYKLWAPEEKMYIENIDSFSQKINANKYRTILQSSGFEVEKIITDSVPIAVSIFHAINVGGMKLTASDIMGCFLFDDAKEWFFHEQTDLFREETFQRGYELKKELQLKLVSFMLSGRLNNKDIYSLDKDEVIENWQKMKRSVFLAIDFFKNNYNIEKINQLSSNFLLHLVSYFFYNNNNSNPSAVQRKKIEKLIIHIGLNDSYISAGPFRVEKDALKILKIINNEELTNSDVNMIRFGTEDEIHDILQAGIFKQLNSLGRFSSFIYSVLAMNHPESFSTGMRVLSRSTETNNQVHKHHIFPKSVYGNQSNNIFNIMLLDAETNTRIGNRTPKDYILDYRDNEMFMQNMKSHFIEEEEIAFIESDDMEGFKKSRMLKMMNFMNSYFQ